MPEERQKNLSAEPDAGLLDALTGRDASAELAVALKTRRAVYIAAVEQRTERSEERRHIVLAVVVCATLALLLVPALWAGIDDVMTGETLLDLPGMLVALGLTLFSAMLAVFFVISSERHNHSGAAHHFRR